MARLDPRVAAEIVRCRADFLHFCTHLKIIDKAGRLIPFVPHAAQLAVLRLLEGGLWSFVLKARRVGCSTLISAWIFWRVLFHPHMRAAVIAHLDESVQELLGIHRTFHENLPPWMRSLFPVAKSNTQELAFGHGGRIRGAGARSEKLRSSGYQIVHASEVAKYADVRRMMQSVFAAADGSAHIIMETTAAGVNEAWHFWNSSGEFEQASHFARLFVSWLIDPTATVTPGDPAYVPPFETPALMAWESDLKAEIPAITPGQLAFARKELVKQGGDFSSFDQELPTTALKAFVLSGRPFFAVRFPEADGLPLVEGLVIRQEPKPYHVYAMGVDVAAGLRDGDRSAVLVLDVTDWLHDPKALPVDVASLYVRQEVIPFSDALHALAVRYNNAMVCVERNNHGIVTIQRLKHRGHPHLYRTIVPGKAGQEGTERIGWDTSPRTRPMMLSLLQEFVTLKGWRPGCMRLRIEANAFQWDRTGTPDHPPGGSSDMIFAAGMAFQAMTQCAEVHATDVIFERRPQTFEARVQFEIATGILLESFDGAFGDDVSASVHGESLESLLR